MVINVMLVEDEPHIRLILRKVIEKRESFKVVYECDNMTDGLLGFNEYKPQVVFMDIEINKSSGIDCAKVISQIAPDTKIIFATAHSEYMSNAFEMYAFDYLIKPFNIERINHTLERIERIISKDSITNNDSANENSSDNSTLNEKGSQEKEDKTQLLIKGKESLNFISVQDIIMIERADNSTYIYTVDGEIYNTSVSLSELENRLPTDVFMRSHKSYIINTTYIKKIEPYGRWSYIVKFKSTDKDALITKEKFEQIKRRFIN
jgi:two-component system LytT family response regulator